MLIFGTILQVLTVAFVLLGNKEESNHVNLSVFYFESKVISLTAYAYLDICRVDGVICLVQPPTETIVNPAAVSILYSDLASDGS